MDLFWKIKMLEAFQKHTGKGYIWQLWPCFSTGFLECLSVFIKMDTEVFRPLCAVLFN